MSGQALEFWFDFASTYSYVAAARIEDLCRSARVPLTWKPFVLGPIFELQGWNTSPFNLNPLRGSYMWRDMERLTQKFGLPWKRPGTFPRNSILAGKIAAAYADEPWIGTYIRALFAENFGADADIADEAVVRRALAVAGVEPGAAMRRALEDPLRSRLRANTQEAIERGIFGAPNCIVDGELFWGEETLDDAIAWAHQRSSIGAGLP